MVGATVLMQLSPFVHQDRESEDHLGMPNIFFQKAIVRKVD